MKIIYKPEELIEDKGLAATTGFFDGVHLGHRFMLGELMRIAEARGLASAVITFPVHPRCVLKGDFHQLLLNSFEEKLERLAETGLDYCIVIDFTPDFARLSAESYIADILSRQYNVKTLLKGYDHRFGCNRGVEPENYGKLGESCGMDIVEVQRYIINDAPISSSVIRRLLGEGRVEEAAERLSYPYQLQGTVVAGHQIGRTLNFPTMNISLNSGKLIPAPGVYAANALLDGHLYKGMLYIGTRPTFTSPHEQESVIEIHLLAYEEKQEAYGKNITVTFEHYVRKDIRFNSTQELKHRLQQDKRTILNLLNNGRRTLL